MEPARSTSLQPAVAGCLGLLCSSRCPGGLVLKLYDLAKALRDAGVEVVGGFQTPMEEEALAFLLRGQQRVVWVPSWHRSIAALPPDASRAHQEGRLIVHNIFPRTARRPSRARGHERNLWIADNANALMIVHATPGGETHDILRHAVENGKSVAVLDDPGNEYLLQETPGLIVLNANDAAIWFKGLSAGHAQAPVRRAQ